MAQDFVEAMRWFRKAADQGYAAAQFNVGFLYHTVLGVTQDYVEAMRWYQKAAEQGDVDAQDKIGIFYANGCRLRGTGQVRRRKSEGRRHWTGQ